MNEQDKKQKTWMEAVAEWNHGDAVALVYGSNRCAFAKVVPGQAPDFGPNGIPTNIYEARVFNEYAELRWVGDPSTVGDSEQLGNKAMLPDDMKMIDSDVKDELPAKSYLLWGTANEVWTGPKKSMQAEFSCWVELFEHRVGYIYVPYAERLRENDARLAISFIEYLCVNDDNGNMSVKAERLTGIHEYPAEKPN